MSDFIFTLTSLFLAVVPVYVVTAMRDTVKKKRRVIIHDLTAAFDRNLLRRRGSRSLWADREVVQSFEFVKFKYSVPGAKSQVLAPRRIYPARYARPQDPFEPDLQYDFLPDEWLIAALPLVMMLFAFSYAAMIVVAMYLDFPVPSSVSGDVLAGLRKHPDWPLAFLTAYVGGYVFMFRAFHQAINNFDLAPESFYGAIKNMLLGLILAFIVTFGLLQVKVPGAPQIGVHITHVSILTVTCFLACFMPESALRAVFSSKNILSFKREMPGIFAKFKVVPLEVIDGIDSSIRDILSDFHIISVQNLAAANPIMLFVETPFGVYEIMDWVAQAQLCASVGPNALVKLWALGIRTIFDLERLGLHDGFCQQDLLKAVGSIILDTNPAGSAGVRTPPQPFDPAAIKANIQMRVDSPYVHRLRQIFIRVGENLGPANLRLPPLMPCPLRTETKCLLR